MYSKNELCNIYNSSTKLRSIPIIVHKNAFLFHALQMKICIYPCIFLIFLSGGRFCLSQNERKKTKKKLLFLNYWSHWVSLILIPTSHVNCFPCLQGSVLSNQKGKASAPSLMDKAKLCRFLMAAPVLLSSRPLSNEIRTRGLKSQSTHDLQSRNITLRICYFLLQDFSIFSKLNFL